MKKNWNMYEEMPIKKGKHNRPAEVDYDEVEIAHHVKGKVRKSAYQLKMAKQAIEMADFEEVFPMSLPTEPDPEVVEPEKLEFNQYISLVNFVDYFMFSEQAGYRNSLHPELGWIPPVVRKAGKLIKVWSHFLLRGNHTVLMLNSDGVPMARWIFDHGEIKPAPRLKTGQDGKPVHEVYKKMKGKHGIDLFPYEG